MLGYKFYTVKKITIFPSPARMSLTKFSLAGNNFIILDRVWLVTGRLGTGKLVIFFTVYNLSSYLDGDICTKTSSREL
jgi:hypothetical protein